MAVEFTDSCVSENASLRWPVSSSKRSDPSMFGPQGNGRPTDATGLTSKSWPQMGTPQAS